MTCNDDYTTCTNDKCEIPKIKYCKHNVDLTNECTWCLMNKDYLLDTDYGKILG